MIDLPEGFTSRPATEEDIDEFVGVIDSAMKEVDPDEVVESADAMNVIRMPGFDLRESSLLAVDSAGQIVGGELFIHMPPYVSANAFGAVLPSHKGQGIGTALLRWAIDSTADGKDQAPEDSKITLHTGVNVEDSPSISMFEGLGLTAARYFMDMEIDLTDRLQEPALPDGIEIRSFRDGEERSLYAVLRDSFSDHWGYVDRPFEEAFERFEHRMRDERFDRTTWWAAFDGDEIAGINLCAPRHRGDDTFAYCENLGVLPDWRRQGLALGMLVSSFHEFRERGHTMMGLGVDVASLTGATALYEKAGMHSTRRFVLYEALIRDGESMMVEGL